MGSGPVSPLSLSKKHWRKENRRTKLGKEGLLIGSPSVGLVALSTNIGYMPVWFGLVFRAGC